MDKLRKLLEEMTLEEKASQLISYSFNKIYDMKNKKIREGAEEYIKNGVGHLGRVGGSTDNTPEEVALAVNTIQEFILKNSRLHIPTFFITEGTSAVLGRGFTLFPGNLNLGASFDDGLSFKIGEAIAKEMQSVGENIALAPVVDLVRDNRYGRFEECYSEDSYLTTQHGIAYIKGMQGENLDHGVGATLKHFVGQGISDGGRNCAPIHLAQREFHDEYLTPFEATISQTNPASVMVAYHEIDGVPCHASNSLLKDTLREKLGFKGLIMSDGNGVQLIKDFHEYARDYKAASKFALNAGIELELGDIFKENVCELVKEGTLDVKVLDDAVMSVLTLKEQLGLFEGLQVDIDKVSEVVHSKAHLETSKEAALSSIVLLENKNNILPIKKGKYKKMAVVGPLAHRKEYAYGDYSYPTHIKEVYYNAEGLTEEEIVARSLFNNSKDTPYDELLHDMPTVYEGIKNEFSDSEVVFVEGLKDTYNYDKIENFSDFDTVRQNCKDADIIFAVLGDTSGMGGTCDTGESVDRVEITLSKEQQELITVLKEFGKPIVLILANGRPYQLTYEAEVCDAILETFRLGQMGTDAIVDVLTGRYNPSGRMPVTTPKHQGQLPVYYSQRITGHKQFWRSTYLEMDTKPLYNFGYGLSYTNFEYSGFELEKTEKGVFVRFNLKNTGEYSGHEVVQIYVAKKYTSTVLPKKELKAFKKVWVEKGEEVKVEAFIDFNSLGYTNIDMDFVLEDCLMEIDVAKSSEDIIYKFNEELTFDGGKHKIINKVFTNYVNII